MAPTQSARRATTRSDELLRSKLSPPPPQPSLLVRDRLFARLEQGLARPITLIAAPAGFGKTTLVGEWAARGRPVAWVSLDDGDNDPNRFWRYVIAACRSDDEALGRSALAALRSAERPSFESVLTSFVNDLSQRSSPLILVLDDYQVISSSEIHQALIFLLDHPPASFRLVLVTRTEPPLPLARWRARNELIEIGPEDLRFSPDEAQALFAEVIQTPLGPESLDRLQERTGGWAAGLRLIGLAVQGQKDPARVQALIADMGERQISDFLIEEVFARLPESTQTFVLQTSVLDRLNAALCAAVTGRGDSGNLLEELARRHQILVPLGETGASTWYRYPALFSDARQRWARQRLGEAERRGLADKAALWLESQGYLDQAIEQSIEAHAFERAAAWIERLAERRGAQELYTWRRWIERLEPGVLDRHPELCFILASALLFSDRFSPEAVARVENPLRKAEQAWSLEENYSKLGLTLALRAIMFLWQGELSRAFAHARESLELLADDEASWRASSLICVGTEEIMAGDVGAAQIRFVEARALAGAVQNIHGELAALTLSADASVWQGDLDQAAKSYAIVLADAVGGEEMLDDQATACAGLAQIEYRRNELQAAEVHAQRAVDLSRQRSNEESETTAVLVQARVQNVLGRAAEAQDALRALLAKMHRPRLLARIRALQARLALDAGDLESARRWRALLAPDRDIPRLDREQEDLAAAHLYLAEGNPRAALALLEEWRADAHRLGRAGSEIEILAVKALAHSADSDQERAAEALARALTLAQPRNIRRPFIDEGEPMAELIQRMKDEGGRMDSRIKAEGGRTRPRMKDEDGRTGPGMKAEGGRTRPRMKDEDGRMKEFAESLLASFGQPVGQAIHPSSFIPHPLLSPQELRVLRLLCAGLSNPEIARELVVSTNTIKTQLQSIYRKLDVADRAEAADAARRLKLI